MQKKAFRDARRSSLGRRAILAAIALAATLYAAQVQSTPPAMTAAPGAAGEAAQAAPPKLTDKQEQGLRLLKAAEGEAGGLEVDMRAFVLWRASYAYAKVDAKKAESVSKESFTASEAIEDPADRDQCGPIGSAGDIKSWIQERVLSELVRKEKIAEVEELLPQATEPVRNQITRELVNHLVEKKDLARAEALLSQLASSEDYPFDAAASLLVAFGPEQSADRMRIFAEALNNFEQHGSKVAIGQHDFGDFITQVWKYVPSAVVLEAINQALDEAKSKESHSHYSMASAKGGIALNSPYEFRLFQLLPVLEELDKDKAESLLRDDTELQAQLKKYPGGMASLHSDGGLSYGISDDDSPQAAQGTAEMQARAEMSTRMDAIRKETEKDPDQALSDALGLPATSGRQSFPRVDALLMVAQSLVKKDPKVAKSALDELWKSEDQWSSSQTSTMAELPKIYLDLGDEDGTKKALKTMLKAADRLYAQDTDADDPNKAFKGTWPSADLWRKCVQVAAKISPALAEEIIGEIPDPEIAASEKVAFASSLLGAGGEPIVVSDCRKNRSSYNVSF
jgi:hypothetical protein